MNKKIRLKGNYKAMSCLNSPTTAEIELTEDSLIEQLTIHGYFCGSCLSDINLKKEPNVCSICGFNKKDKVITYEDWKGVIRDTPLTIKGLKQVGRTLFFVDLDDESIGVLATSIIDYLNKRERSDE